MSLPDLCHDAAAPAEPQEDAHAVALNVENEPTTGFFAVFDGHGGKEVAKFAALYMVRAGRLAP